MQEKKAKRTFKYILLLVSLVSILLPRGTKANFLDYLGCGARPMGLGSAYTAVSDDLWSIYYNVAGLDQITDNMVQLAYIWANPNLNAESATDPGFHDVHRFPYHLNAPLIGAALDMGKMFARSMPVNIKFGAIVAMPDNFHAVYYAWDAPYTVPLFPRLGSNWQRVSLIGGLSLSTNYLPWVSVGIGFRFMVTGTTYAHSEPGGLGGGITINPVDPDRMIKGANIELSANSLITPTCGIMLYPLQGLRLGYSYRGQTALTMDPIIVNATLFIDNTSLLRMTIPVRIQAYYAPQQHNWGVSYKWEDKILVALDVSWFRWSRYTSIVRGDPDPLWNDSWITRIGVEYYPIAIIALRGGYFFEPSPIPDQVKLSNFLDNDKHVFSVGFGVSLQDPFLILLRPLDFNIAVQYTWLPERNTVKDTVYGGVPEMFSTRGYVIAAGGDFTIRF